MPIMTTNGMYMPTPQEMPIVVAACRRHGIDAVQFLRIRAIKDTRAVLHVNLKEAKGMVDWVQTHRTEAEHIIDTRNMVHKAAKELMQPWVRAAREVMEEEFGVEVLERDIIHLVEIFYHVSLDKPHKINHPVPF